MWSVYTLILYLILNVKNLHYSVWCWCSKISRFFLACFYILFLIFPCVVLSDFFCGCYSEVYHRSTRMCNKVYALKRWRFVRIITENVTNASGQQSDIYGIDIGPVKSQTRPGAKILRPREKKTVKKRIKVNFFKNYWKIFKTWYIIITTFYSFFLEPARSLYEARTWYNMSQQSTPHLLWSGLVAFKVSFWLGFFGIRWIPEMCNVNLHLNKNDSDATAMNEMWEKHFTGRNAALNSQMRWCY